MMMLSLTERFLVLTVMVRIMNHWLQSSVKNARGAEDDTIIYYVYVVLTLCMKAFQMHQRFILLPLFYLFFCALQQRWWTRGLSKDYVQTKLVCMTCELTGSYPFNVFPQYRVTTTLKYLKCGKISKSVKFVDIGEEIDKSLRIKFS